MVPIKVEDQIKIPLAFRRIQSADPAAWEGKATDAAFESLVADIASMEGMPEVKKRAAAKQATPRKKTPAKKSARSRRLAIMTGKGAPSWDQDEKLNRRILIEGGEFLMGSPEGVGEHRERPQHLVRLSPFCLQEHPVTNEEYRRFEPDHGFSEGEEKHPAVDVSWEDADAYARWLRGRLPTEAEWEYACRAGTDTAYWSGDSEGELARVGWYDANSAHNSHPVGEKPANPWGLYDLHGNVWEWTADWYQRYPGSPQVDPINSDSSSGWRVVRGGSFVNPAGDASSAHRYRLEPRNRFSYLGFRVAFDAAPSDNKT